MLPAEVHLTFDNDEPKNIQLTHISPSEIVLAGIDDVGIQLTHITPAEIVIVGSGSLGPQGPPGPEGPEGQWLALTQSEYDALDPPDADTLYVIIP